MRFPRFLVSVAAATAILVACSESSTGNLAANISIFPDDSSKPYVITAIDYHFHDAHPSRPIVPGRTVIFTSAARNLHNVTIPEIGYSKDLKPGGKIVIHDIASLLGGPGQYAFFCKYHVDLNPPMQGVIVITG